MNKFPYKPANEDQLEGKDDECNMPEFEFV
jgi:hypothetical protein